jgi:hypothetical protein
MLPRIPIPAMVLFVDSQRYAFVMTDIFVKREFDCQVVLTFHLVRYHPNGTFLGLRMLTSDLNRFGEPNGIEQIWQNFGGNLR